MEQQNNNLYQGDVDMKLLDDLIGTINTFINTKVEKAINQTNVEMCWSGIVDSVDANNNTATVSLPFGEKITDIPNLTGQTLEQNDKVKIYADHMNMADCYIGTVYK